MITLQHRHINQLADTYLPLFESVFGKWETEGNCPADVYLTYDGDTLIGFMSGFPISQTTWYLQRGGFTKGEQSKFMNLRRYNDALSLIPFPYVMALVRNDDLPALKICLGSGFTIIGTRIDTVKNLWVELLRKGDING